MVFPLKECKTNMYIPGYIWIHSFVAIINLLKWVPAYILAGAHLLYYYWLIGILSKGIAFSGEKSSQSCFQSAMV